MLKYEKRKKIYEAKTNEIVRERSKEDIDDKWRIFANFKRNEWFDEECTSITRAKKSLQLEYTKKSAMMTQMELIRKYNTKHLSREMFRKVNDTRRAFITRTNSCRSKTGEIISDIQGVINRWSEHFRELLDMFNKLDNTGIYENIVPSYEEIHKAVEKPKNNKAPGTDEILNELIKNACGNYIKELTLYLE
ncbi:hypothetical protein CWI38_1102p0010 [Hamiltosporidium tvaerminnensis]|uniref:Uncharacterized protein n=1 Tax=Hamiltosporidium tvaerminnensis TaxID=1176355 RepID=A0A4Q9LT43_9MICR|nr:hypothetical protein CWI38_1102p0010 [Hamiltosporidium tvaerminnensis]